MIYKTTVIFSVVCMPTFITEVVLKFKGVYADPFLWYACTKISNTRQNGNDGKDWFVDNKSLTVSRGKQTNVFIKKWRTDILDMIGKTKLYSSMNPKISGIIK